MKPINKLLLSLSKRAERATITQLVSSFVDAGSLIASVGNNDHQVIYGRRGTGKTHVLAKLSADATKSGNMAIQIDLRTLGSNGGIYADPNIPLAERATRLLVDLLGALHSGILEGAINDESYDLNALQPGLDDLQAAISKVRVVGPVVNFNSTQQSAHTDASVALGLNGLSQGVPGAGMSFGAGESASRSAAQTVIGDQRRWINFGEIASCLRRVCGSMNERRIWLLLDEWSEVPFDLQPYLGDLLRRCVFPVHGVVTKIAAIEQRTNFRTSDGVGGYLGIEIGADASTSLTLDDFMVFDNNAALATNFFRSLLWKHVISTAEDDEVKQLSEEAFSSQAFTQVSSVQELVRAAEGVPRDAINIIALAAQNADNRLIAVNDVRVAARQWYQQSKEAAVSARNDALNLLQWIRESVIGARKARAFLLPSDVRNGLIDYLYDSRVLHIIKRGVSSNETPGVRYNVYAIDYGCYVDLTSTASAPLGLFEAELDSGGAIKYVAVPATDYRSIRRAILDLSKFENSLPSN